MEEAYAVAENPIMFPMSDIVVEVLPTGSGVLAERAMEFVFVKVMGRY